MSTGYETVLAQTDRLASAVETAIARDAQDISRLRILSLAVPPLAQVYAAVSVAQWAVYAQVRGLMSQVNLAFRNSELSRSAQVVVKKRNEADQWRQKSDQLRQQGTQARTLRGRSVNWLGDAGDLYRDTAQVCSQGLAEMADQYINSARFCTDVARYHTQVYNLVSVYLAEFSGMILTTHAPHLVFFARSNQARVCLQLALQMAAKAEAGELGRDGLIAMGQRMRGELNNNDTLTNDFRADPRLARDRSSTTTG